MVQEKKGNKIIIDLDVYNSESSVRKSFAKIIKNNGSSDRQKWCEKLDSIPLKLIPSPKVIRGNAVVEIHDEDYKRGVEHLQFNVLGTLSLIHGDSAPMTMEVKSKLVQKLQIENIE